MQTCKLKLSEAVAQRQAHESTIAVLQSTVEDKAALIASLEEDLLAAERAAASAGEPGASGAGVAPAQLPVALCFCGNA